MVAALPNSAGRLAGLDWRRKLRTVDELAIYGDVSGLLEIFSRIEILVVLLMKVMATELLSHVRNWSWSLFKLSVFTVVEVPVRVGKMSWISNVAGVNFRFLSMLDYFGGRSLTC